MKRENKTSRRFTYTKVFLMNGLVGGPIDILELGPFRSGAERSGIRSALIRIPDDGKQSLVATIQANIQVFILRPSCQMPFSRLTRCVRSLSDKVSRFRRALSRIWYSSWASGTDPRPEAIRKNMAAPPRECSQAAAIIINLDYRVVT